MTKSAKKKDADEGTRELSYEGAMEKLESIVEQMESDDLPLETLLERFEEGSKLAGLCQAKLEDAELKIQKLERKGQEPPSLKPVKLEDEPLND